MFDLVLALIIFPMFVAASIYHRSWLIFNESKRMFSKREEELEEELEIIFSSDWEDSCLDKNLLKFDLRHELEKFMPDLIFIGEYTLIRMDLNKGEKRCSR